eukprot:12925106-Prorocentrum_lima.AAC.1
MSTATAAIPLDFDCPPSLAPRSSASALAMMRSLTNMSGVVQPLLGVLAEANYSYGSRPGCGTQGPDCQRGAVP